MKNLITTLRFTVVAIAFTLLQSCANPNLFQSKTNDNKAQELASLFTDSVHTIKTDDKVSVSIWNHDDLSVGSVFGIYNSNEVYGKWVLVDKSGFIELPKIGRVNVGGLSTTEAANQLKTPYSKFIKDPIIVVKVLNREVTVLGEVATPGNYLLEKEKNSLFELLGKAGGINYYGNAAELKLIRGNKEFDLDLTSMAEFTQNNIILRAGDIIYVPIKSGKNLDKKAPTIISIASVATTLVVILSLFSEK